MNLKHFPDSFALLDGVYVPREQDKTFGYNDGDDTEQRILAVVRSVQDVSLTSPELAARISDWASLYHLSPRRSNLLRPFASFLKGRVLEIGAGCGAITRFLGELGGQVFACEGSHRRAMIARERTRDLTNVQVLCGRAEELCGVGLFDAVTLIGVLEYAALFNGPGANGLLSVVRSFLKPTGILFVAIENQLGLKYFAGAPEDHLGIPYAGIEDYCGPAGVMTFGQKELSGLLSAAQFSHQLWYAPCPDYKFPSTVLAATCCSPGASADNFDPAPLLALSTTADPQRILSPNFSLERAWEVIARNGLTGQFANSFLVAASAFPEPCNALDQLNTLAWHYGGSPGSADQTELRFISTVEGVFVERTGLERYPQGGELPSALSPYIKGTIWWQKLVGIVNREGWLTTEVIEWAQFWLSELLRSCSGVSSLQSLLDDNLSQATPLNLVVDHHGKCSFCMAEDAPTGTITLGSVLVDGLLSSFNKISSVAPPAADTPIHHGGLITAILSALNFPGESESSHEDLADSISTISSSFVVRQRSVPVYAKREARSDSHAVQNSRNQRPQDGRALPATLDPEIQANLLRPVIKELAGTVAVIGNIEPATQQLLASSACALYIIDPLNAPGLPPPNLHYHENFESFRKLGCTVDSLIVIAPAGEQILTADLQGQLRTWLAVLANGGTLWLATDNRLFTQCFSSGSSSPSNAKGRHSRSELERALGEVGFQSIETTLVFPSVRYPLSHVFPQGLKNHTLQLSPLISGVEPHIRWRPGGTTIHPTDMLRGLTRDDLSVLAPAFLVRCRRANAEAAVNPTDPVLLAALYNPFRMPEFQKETLFVADPQASVSVIRRQRYPGGATGVDLNQTIADEPYYQGAPWISLLYSLFQNPDWELEGLVAWAEKWKAALLSYAHLSADDASWDTPLPAELLDGTPANLIFSSDGTAHFFDLEWVPRAQPSLGAVLVRGLWYSLASVTTVAIPADRSNLRIGHLLQRILLGLGYCVDRSQYERACDVDDWLQTRVTGAPPAAPLLNRIKSAVFTVSGDHESGVLVDPDVSSAIRERDAEIFRLGHEITQVSVAIADMSARHAAEQAQATAHIASLEKVAVEETQERRRLQAELERASEHILTTQMTQGLRDASATKHIQALETGLADSIKEGTRLKLLLDETSKTITHQHFIVEQRDCTILGLQEELRRVSEQVVSLNADRLFCDRAATSHITALEASLASCTSEMARLNELLLGASHALQQQHADILARDSTILNLQSEIVRLGEFIHSSAAAAQERDKIALQRITFLQQEVADRDRTILNASVAQPPIIANSD